MLAPGRIGTIAAIRGEVMRTALRIVFATALALAPSVLHATDANLDPSFGSYGWTSINLGPTWDIGRSVAIQTDGRIVVAGDTTVARYTSSGALDPTFDSDGVTYGPGPTQASGIAIQPGDGAIVLAGSSGSETDRKVTVARLDATGAADMTFGTGGVSTLNVRPPVNYESFNAVALQADGGIVAVGWAYVGSQTTYDTEAVVARFLSDGTPDATFGTGGVVELDLPGAAFAQDVAIQPDGKIVVGGYQYVPYFSGSIQAFMLLRLEADGDLDTGFAGTGIIVNGPRPEGSALGNAVAIQPDGKILLGGFAGGSPHVLRYLPSGSADGAFGDAGIAKTTYDDFDSAPMFDLVLQSDGKIVLVGAVSSLGASPFDTGLVRFNDDGSLDTTFTPTGRARIAIGPRQSAAMGAAQQADGKIVVTGYLSEESELESMSDTELLVGRFGGSCGDAFVDAGEQCDDGNTNGRDCCSAGCGFDPAGQPCDGDASLCTYDLCDGAGACVVGGPWPASECKAVTQPLKSSLAVRDGTPGTDKITFKWTKGAENFFFGNPILATDYSLCVFGGTTLASQHLIPYGSGWTYTSKGWKYKRNPVAASPAGIHSARLQGGIAGRPRIIVKGKGPFLSAPVVPLTTPVTAQLVSSDGRCFGATYTSPAINAGGKFKAKGE